MAGRESQGYGLRRDRNWIVHLDPNIPKGQILVHTYPDNGMREFVKITDGEVNDGDHVDIDTISRAKQEKRMKRIVDESWKLGVGGDYSITTGTRHLFDKEGELEGYYLDAQVSILVRKGRF